MKKHLELTEIQRDALKEIASIGISHSATALSKMINKKVMIDVPKVNILSINKLADVLTTSNELIVGIYFKVLGKVSGKVLLSFKKESALVLADILMKKSVGETKILAEMEQSALKELGAISTAVCLNALAEFLGMVLLPSIPHFMYDYSDSIVKSLFDEVKSDTEYVVVVDSEFKESNNKILGRFLIFPNEDAFESIWHALKINRDRHPIFLM
ncbi:MAG: chemotaxis protein CheC [Candidatus Firestonebacteria bacterium]